MKKNIFETQDHDVNNPFGSVNSDAFGVIDTSDSHGGKGWPEGKKKPDAKDDEEMARTMGLFEEKLDCGCAINENLSDGGEFVGAEANMPVNKK